MRRQLALGVHLTRREIGRANRWTLLGRLWPPARSATTLRLRVAMATDSRSPRRE